MIKGVLYNVTKLQDKKISDVTIFGDAGVTIFGEGGSPFLVRGLSACKTYPCSASLIPRL